MPFSVPLKEHFKLQIAYHEEDFFDLCALWSRHYLKAQNFELYLNYPLLFQKSFNYSHLFQSEFFILKNADHKIVGFVAGLMRVDHHHHSWCFLSNLIIDPKYQGLGLSYHLLNPLLEWAKTKNALGILLFCEKNLSSFYHKFNFQFLDPDFLISWKSSHHLFDSQTKCVFFSSQKLPHPYKKYLEDQFDLLNQKLLRDPFIWNVCLQIPQTKIYFLEKNHHIVAAAIVGKGIDLINIVHEYYGENQYLFELFQYLLNEYKAESILISAQHSFMAYLKENNVHFVKQEVQNSMILKLNKLENPPYLWGFDSY